MVRKGRNPFLTQVFRTFAYNPIPLIDKIMGYQASIDLDSKVREFLTAHENEKRQVILNHIFEQLYEAIESTIRSYLYYQNIDVKALGDQFYDTVFFHVYQKVFALESFLVKLQKFDPSRKFQPWIKTVIRNTVRDWLRKVDPATKMSNRDTLDDVIKNDRTQVHLDEPEGGRAGHPVRRHAVIKGRSEHACESELIDRLEVQHRMILKLRYIAIIDMSSSELEEAKRISRKPLAQIHAEIKQLAHRQRTSKDMEAYHLSAIQLYSLHFFILKDEKQLTAARKRLVDLCYSEQKLMSIEREAQAITFKGIKTDRQHLLGLRKKVNDNETLRNVEVQLMELEYLHAHKRYVYDYEKYKNLVNSFVNGKQYRALEISAQDIAKLLKITEQAVYSRVNRAKKELGVVLVKNGLNRKDERKD